MSSGYQIDKQDGTYFITSTVVEWVDLFIRDKYKQLIADSLNYCTKEFGLEIFSYVIMTSHLHMICRAREKNLSKLIGSFKKYTLSELIRAVKCSAESRREWMLKIFAAAGEANIRNSKYQIWQQNSHAEEVYSRKFTLSKIKYIHNNPVEEGIVVRPEDYLYSSAKDYAGMKSPVKVTLLELHSLFY
jgi:putative transposase